MDQKTVLNQRELDLLRLTALLCVVGLHVGSSVWSDMTIGTPAWLAATVLRTTWAVPVFVMITGRFLLDPERRPPLRRYGSRIVRAMALWGLVYQLRYLALDWQQYTWKRFAAGVFTGAYHMWYLWMLLGLYLLTPLLRRISEDRRLTGYFLLLHLLWQSLSWFAAKLPFLGNTLSAVLAHVDLSFVAGFPAYALLGFWLHGWHPTRKQRHRLYLLALGCWGISLAGNLWISMKTGVNSEFFTSYRSPLLMPRAAAVFVFFEKELGRVHWSPGMEKALAFFREQGLGAYLVHALATDLTVGVVGKGALAARPWIWIPVLTVLVAGESFAFAWALRKLPGIGKWMT